MSSLFSQDHMKSDDVKTRWRFLHAAFLSLQLHERLRRFGAQKPAPIQDHAEQLAREVMKDLKARPETAELLHILSKPHFQDLLSVHDTVAQKDYEPELPSLTVEADEDEEDTVRMIQLMKSKEPLVFVRALFDYHPGEDPAIPCKDAGLEFWRGDVLHFVSQEDDTWWQTRRIVDASLRAGLNPSRQLQQRE
ncbi:MAGUK p55 subfamily member 7-like [Clarias magur]|uniref:MAGUK p55 subfamily member 7-like n=1 Tax=Clarias magur TaxID=1594786 RepID=A0A8J4U9G3_CLAMG|nr:MAGUK p55 subfamily member 7-like [Clarias magur]